MLWPVFNLVALLVIVGLSAEPSSQASQSCHRLNRLKYELFGTKTSYKDARDYFSGKDDEALPKGFDDDPIAEDHSELVNEKKCTPLVFYFVGRHSARFPDADDIEQYNKDLKSVLEKLETKSLGKDCPELKAFLEWKTKMDPKQDNLITDLGAKEEVEIAKRFKALYPEFFDAEKADVTIGVTEKLRTAQTGYEFLKEVDNLKLDDCSHVPSNDGSKSSYDVKDIIDSKCYKNIIKKHAKPILEFHKQCEKISGSEKEKNPLVERAKSPDLYKKIADRVAEKLHLDNSGSEPPICARVLTSIYNMCKFENAIDGESVWCNLFSQSDIEALEYMEDVSSYLKGAYGPQVNPKQSCPLMKDLLDALHEGKELSESDKKKAYFYFTHADVLKKIYATFELFRDDRSFSESAISNFEQDFTVPSKRNWRSSVITPFSGNMAFALYKCPAKKKKPIRYKVLTMVTEQPVEVGGCDDEDCKLEEFFAKYDRLRDCDLKRECSH